MPLGELMSTRATADDAAQLRALGLALGRHLVAGDVVALTGPLGAGKTTFTQGLAEGLGVQGPVTSPTFVIMRLHKPLGSRPGLTHIDAYRLADDADVRDLDLDEYPQNVVVAEWGDELAARISDSWLHIDIQRADSAATDSDDPAAGQRTVTAIGHGPDWKDRIPDRWWSS